MSLEEETRPFGGSWSLSNEESSGKYVSEYTSYHKKD